MAWWDPYQNIVIIVNALQTLIAAIITTAVS